MSIYLDKAEMKFKKRRRRRVTRQIYSSVKIAWVLASCGLGFKSGASQLCDLRQIDEPVKNYKPGSLQPALVGCSKGVEESRQGPQYVLISWLV